LWVGRVPRELILAEIDWRVDLGSPFVFHVEREGVGWSLRVNDFPDEVMFSLFRAGVLVAEFDDRPVGWHLHREF